MTDVGVAKINQALEARGDPADKGVRRAGVGVQSDELLRCGQGCQCAFPHRFKWNLQWPRPPALFKSPGYYVEVFGQAPFEVGWGAVGGEVSAVMKWLLRDGMKPPQQPPHAEDDVASLFGREGGVGVGHPRHPGLDVVLQ